MNLWIAGIIVGLFVQVLCTFGYLMDTRVVEIRKDIVTKLIMPDGTMGQVEYNGDFFEKFIVTTKKRK